MYYTYSKTLIPWILTSVHKREEVSGHCKMRRTENVMLVPWGSQKTSKVRVQSVEGREHRTIRRVGQIWEQKRTDLKT